MTIGYLGPKGTFTHHAAQQILLFDELGVTTELIEKASLDQLFDGLKTSELLAILTPIENSIEGSVNRVLDNLTHTNDTYIVDIFTMPIKQSLLAKSPINLSNIKHIISMPHAIAQCYHFIQKHCANAVIHHAPSTAASVQMMTGLDLPDHETVIIGHHSIVQHHNLQVIENNIHDQKKNATEFCIIKPTMNQLITKKSYCTLAFSTKRDQPGSLVKVLQVFEQHGINLTKILSRPEKSMIGSYIFYVEFNISTSQKQFMDMLDLIKENCLYFKSLGIYTKRQIND